MWPLLLSSCTELWVSISCAHPLCLPPQSARDLVINLPDLACDRSAGLLSAAATPVVRRQDQLGQPKCVQLPVPSSQPLQTAMGGPRLGQLGAPLDDNLIVLGQPSVPI